MPWQGVEALDIAVRQQILRLLVKERSERKLYLTNRVDGTLCGRIMLPIHLALKPLEERSVGYLCANYCSDHAHHNQKNKSRVVSSACFAISARSRCICRCCFVVSLGGSVATSPGRYW